MANASFQISFRGGEPVSGTVRFDPGSRLEGLVQIMPMENIRAKRVIVRVGWHTEGRGDQDRATVGELQIAQGNRPPTRQFRSRFRWICRASRGALAVITSTSYGTCA